MALISTRTTVICIGSFVFGTLLSWVFFSLSPAEPVGIVPVNNIESSRPVAGVSIDASDHPHQESVDFNLSFYHRPLDEWQGMRVSINEYADCSENGVCGLALACIDGRCEPCKAESDCIIGESCVLDHCVPERNVECSSRRDCPDEELCVLSGYSTDARGNSTMTATCLNPRSGVEQDPDSIEQPTIVEASPRPMRMRRLRDAIELRTAE